MSVAPPVNPFLHPGDLAVSAHGELDPREYPVAVALFRLRSRVDIDCTDPGTSGLAVLEIVEANARVRGLIIDG